MNKLLIIDGLNLVRRIHAVLPDENDIDSVKVRSLAACHKMLQHHKPTHVIVVWDGEQESWRKKLYPDYKKGRKPMPAPLQKGLKDIKVALAAEHIHSLDALAEADDVIATLALKITQNQGLPVVFCL